jgi:hypothetical protein
MVHNFICDHLLIIVVIYTNCSCIYLTFFLLESQNEVDLPDLANMATHTGCKIPQCMIKINFVFLL